MKNTHDRKKYLISFFVQSEDSMDHLSAEERACLTYLEETIEALETQEDSGVSNDDSHHESLTEKADQMRVNGMWCAVVYIFLCTFICIADARFVLQH